MAKKTIQTEVWRADTLGIYCARFDALLELRGQRIAPPDGGGVICLSLDTALTRDGQPVPDLLDLLSWFRETREVRVEIDRALQKYGHVVAARFSAG